MTPCDVVRAAVNLRAEIVVPIHYDLWERTWEGSELVRLIMRKWNVNLEVVVLCLGDRLTVRG